MIRVLLFAGLAEVAGASEIHLEVGQGPLSIETVREKLSLRYPAMADLLGKSMAAINQEYANASDLIRETDEVAFIPPVSGG
ncbi:molybdopterin converting factor subunit 1 [Ammoniphilus sp. CFH 90114]|uniref:molybdopterin converting factor subunit 1 n=1 Tax=Ammoniphilus sp. CFH 90114 TaxID=2493665 RepID=UPI00100F81BE|nr:molybdopterin converting factor subunit 1 [Ammoniphilus sp. CFH 90114]RXT05841.1 molybdopterin converting factor subunit 1 [Ammoniphilus sp. CFH 90114]